MEGGGGANWNSKSAISVAHSNLFILLHFQYNGDAYIAHYVEPFRVDCGLAEGQGVSLFKAFTHPSAAKCHNHFGAAVNM